MQTTYLARYVVVTGFRLALIAGGQIFAGQIRGVKSARLCVPHTSNSRGQVNDVCATAAANTECKPIMLC